MHTYRQSGLCPRIAYPHCMRPAGRSSKAAAQVVELMGTRKGQMQGMTSGVEGGSRVTYTIPTRGLLGAAHTLPNKVKGSQISLALSHSDEPNVVQATTHNILSHRFEGVPLSRRYTCQSTSSTCV